MPLTPEESEAVTALRTAISVANGKVAELARSHINVDFTINRMTLYGIGEYPVIVPKISREESF